MAGSEQRHGAVSDSAAHRTLRNTVVSAGESFSFRELSQQSREEPRSRRKVAGVTRQVEREGAGSLWHWGVAGLPEWFEITVRVKAA